MLSRVADSVYWMARYLERVENLARFIEVTKNFNLDQPDSGIEQWEPLIRATGDEELFDERYDSYSPENVLQFLTFDTSYPGSIRTAVNAARENARTIQETISSEAWQQLNTLYHFVRRASVELSVPDANFYGEIVSHCYMFTGILTTTMTRGPAWHFANLGQFLERADKTTRILDVKYFTLLRHVEDVDTPVDDLLWSAVLRSVCGFEMYRKRYHVITVRRIAQFLILDQQFPRAVRYCVQQVLESLRSVAGPVPAEQNPALRQAQSTLKLLDELNADTIISRGMHEFTDRLQISFNEIGGRIHDTFFAERPFPVMQQQQQQG
ncbi:MAG: alpha-E domain-containing protein [Fuerstiella sp.]